MPKYIRCRTFLSVVNTPAPKYKPDPTRTRSPKPATRPICIVKSDWQIESHLNTSMLNENNEVERTKLPLIEMLNLII